MPYSRGNLAVQSRPGHQTVRSSASPVRGSHGTIARPVPVSTKSELPVPRPGRVRVSRVSIEQADLRQTMARQKAKSISRQLARRRFMALAGIVLVISVVAAVYGLVVYRQAMILEANFENLKIERNIGKMEQECSQIRESLAQKTNLDLIRQRAIHEIGLQDPAQSQIVRVIVPNTDRVIYASGNADLAEQNAYLSSIFTNIEGFFKTMNQQSFTD